MTKFILSSILMLGVQLAFADEPAPKADDQAAAAESNRDPATEKSFFETRTFEDVQDMVQSLTAADDTAKTGG